MRFPLLTLMAFSLSLTAQTIHVSFDFDINRQDANPGESIVCQAEVQYSDFPVVRFFWTVEGQPFEGETLQFVAGAPGVMAISLIGEDSQGNRGRPYWQYLFVEPVGAETPIDCSLEGNSGPLVLKRTDQADLRALSETPGARFFWNVIGTNLFLEGNTLILKGQDVVADNYFGIELTAIAPDGNAMSWPVFLPGYVFDDNAPPDLRSLTPQPRQVDGNAFIDIQPNQPLTLMAEAIDQDGPEPLTIYWHDLASDTYTQGNTFTFPPSPVGQYPFAVGVLDGAELSDPFPTEFIIWVRDPQSQPTVFIENGSVTLEVGEETRFTAQAFDPEFDPLTISWQLGDGRTMEGSSIDVIYEEPGVFQLSAVAFDDSSASLPWNRWVFVNDSSADFSNQGPFPFLVTPEEGQRFSLTEAVSFHGLGFDPDEEPVTLYWDFGDGTLDQACLQTTHTYPEAGVFWPSVTARDDRGLASHYAASHPIVLTGGDPPPHGHILSPVAEENTNGDWVFEVRPNEPFTLLAEVRNPVAGKSYTFHWTLDWEFLVDGFAPAPQSLSQPGLYVLTLHVSDQNGLEDPLPDHLWLWVRDSNLPPEPAVVEPSSDMVILAGEGINCSATAYDPDGDQVEFLWILSDGRNLQGARLEDLVFPETGLYQLQLMATDDHGLSAMSQQIRYVNVLPENLDWNTQQPPDIRLMEPQSDFVLGPRQSRFHFSVSATDPLGFPIDDYYWDFGNGHTARGDSEMHMQFNQSGVFHVRIFAHNALGLWSMYPANCTVGIYGDNVPPDATIIQPPKREGVEAYERHILPVMVNEPITLQGTARDPDGTISPELLWMVDWQPYSILSTPDPISFPSAGFHELILTARDEQGLDDPAADYRLLHIIDPSLIPSVGISHPEADLVVEPGDELWFSAYGEDPNQLPLNFSWEFGPTAQPQEGEGSDLWPVVFLEPTPEDQPVVVSVRSSNGFAVSEPATLRIHVRTYQDEAFEPNNSLQELSALPLGNFGQLTLSQEDQVDAFSISLPRNLRTLVLKTKAPLGTIGLTVFRMRDSSWQEVEVIPPEQLRPNLPFQSLEAGTYAFVFQRSQNLTQKDGILDYGISLTTSQPSIYLPFLVQDGNWRSTVGLLNPSSENNQTVLVGLDELGNPLASQSRMMVSGGKLDLMPEDLFEGQKEDARAKRVRWLKVISDQPLVAYSNSLSQDGRQLMGSGAFQALHQELTVAHIATDTQTWYTRAELINAGEQDAPLSFEAPTGVTPLGTMKSQTQSSKRLMDLFGETLPEWGRIQTSGSTAGLAGIEVFGRQDGALVVAALEMETNQARNPSFVYVDRSVIFTHVAKDRNNFWTGISLVNLSPQSQECLITAYNDEGVIQATTPWILGPYDKLLGTVDQFFPDEQQISWLHVQGQEPLLGFVLFGDYQGKRIAGFPAAKALQKNMVFPHIQSDQLSVWTGLSVLNMGDQEQQVSFVAYDALGKPLGQPRLVILNPRQKSVQTVAVLFQGSDIPLKEIAYVVASTNQPSLCGFELYGDFIDGALGETMAGISAVGF